MCAQFKNRYCSAEQLYRAAFKAEPSLEQDSTRQHRYNAVRSAVLAGAGAGDEAGKLDDKEKAKLRDRANVWLQADLELIRKQLKAGRPEDVLPIEAALAHWHQDADLATIRDADRLGEFPAEERDTWKKLWSNVTTLLKETRGRINESRMNAALSDKDRTKVHEWKMSAGNVYVIEMESTAFDTFLKLEGPTGKLLAENDDIAPDNLNSRIVFTPRTDGIFRIVSTSFQHQGTGTYLLRIREVKAVP